MEEINKVSEKELDNEIFKSTLRPKVPRKAAGCGRLPVLSIQEKTMFRKYPSRSEERIFVRHLLDLLHFFGYVAVFSSEEDKKRVIAQFERYIELLSSSRSKAYVSLDPELRNVIHFILQP